MNPEITEQDVVDFLFRKVESLAELRCHNVIITVNRRGTPDWSIQCEDVYTGMDDYPTFESAAEDIKKRSAPDFKASLLREHAKEAEARAVELYAQADALCLTPTTPTP